MRKKTPYNFLKDSSKSLDVFIFILTFSYLFQLNVNSFPIDKIFLLVGWTIAIVNIFYHNRTKILLYFVLIIFILLIFDFDTRFMSIVLFSLYPEADIEEILPVFFLSLLFTLPINVAIGYYHINGLAIHLSLIGFITYLMSFKNNPLLIKFLVILTTINYFITGSELALIANIFLLVYLLILRFNIKIIEKTMSLSFPLFFLVNYYLSYLLNNSIFINSNSTKLDLFLNEITWKLDSLMTGRLSFNSVMLQPWYRYKFIGNSLDAVYSHFAELNVYFNIDSAYFQILGNYGLLPLLVILFILTLNSIYQLKIEKKYIILTFIFAFWSMGEDVMTNIAFNLSLLTLNPMFRNVRKVFFRKEIL